MNSTGVLLIGHGTRDLQGTEQFFQLAERLRDRLGHNIPVAAGFLEFQQPSIADAWKSLSDQGVSPIRVAPLLLFAAGHAKQDIPDEIRRCQASAPSVSVVHCGPLSRHPAIIDLLTERLRNAFVSLSAIPFQTPSPSQTANSSRTAVVMVGRGSHDPCAQADMRVLTEVVARRLRLAAMPLPVATVETAFYAMANPRLPEVLDRIASTGNVDAIVVQPHLLFQGRLFDAIKHQCDEARQRHPAVRIVCSNYLGPEPRVAEALADRIATAGAGCIATAGADLLTQAAAVDPARCR